MYGLQIWKTNRLLFKFSELTEADLSEAKDTFPLGTIKKYGEKHLYVKVGGKKPWVYYATLGTEKADAALQAGGVVVVDGKGVAPATSSNLMKYGVKHPHEGGAPPLEPVTAGPAAGLVSVPAVGAVAPEPPKSKPKKKLVKAEPVAPPPAEAPMPVTAPPPELDGWLDYPNPSVAKASIHNFVADVNKHGGFPEELEKKDPLAAKAYSTIFGPKWKEVYNLARSVQNLAGASASSDGILQYAAKHSNFDAKMAQLYGDDWQKKAKAIGLALQAQGALQPQAVAAATPPPMPSPSVDPGSLTIPDLLKDIAKKTGSGDLDAYLLKYPAIGTALSDLYGMHAKDVAHLLTQLIDYGVEKTLKGYGDLPKDHVVHKAIKKIAMDLGVTLPEPAPETPAPAPPPPAPDLSSFVQAIKGIGHPVANITQLSHLALSMPPAALAGYYDPNGAVASGIEVATVAHAIVHGGLTKAAHDYGHLMTADGMHKLWTALGQPPTPTPVHAPAPTPVPVPAPASSYALQNLSSLIKTPKKGQAYQALKKLGYDLESPVAKVVALLHKLGTYDHVVAKLQNYGFTSDQAADLVNGVVQTASEVGAFTWDADNGIPTFPELKTKKKKPASGGDTSGAGAPPAASPVPGGIPKPEELTLKGSGQHLGGAGQKRIYTDAQGKEYLFKVAASKDGSKVEPHRAEVQAAFSAIARKVKPNHPPIGVMTKDGTLGTIYPFIDATGNLKGVSPASLTDVEKFDVATEHMLDWLGSQHDSHAANLLRTTDGRIIGVDKEQGFKYFPDDKLDIDYHPNAKYGENEPFHNKFWRDWSEGKFDFDPKTLETSLKAAEAISPDEYMAALRPYAQHRPPKDKYTQERFLRTALNRKLTLRHDYEKFLSGLYEKKTGKKGSFTFDSGWTLAGEKAKPKTKLMTTSGPDYAAQRGIKVREFKKNDGTSDPTKITLKIPKGSSTTDLEDTLKELGVDVIGPIKEGANNHMVFVDKAAFEAAKITKEVVIEDPKSGKIPPHPGTPSYLPAAGFPPPADANSAEMKKVQDSKSLGVSGQRITLDGKAVESQVAKVKRMKDEQGPYFMVHFKLRRPTWEGISGGTSGSFGLRQASYDAATDSMVEKGSPTVSMSSKKWTAGDSELHLATNTSEWAYMGGVYAKVRPKPGQTVEDGLRELLDKAQPGLSKDILRDPTPEEHEISKLSRLLWNVDPQGSDSLSEGERTVEGLKSRLKKKGVTEEQLASMREVEFMPGHSTYVIPGRWKELAKTSDGQPALRYLQFSASTPARIVSQVKNGLLGIHERALTGQAFFGASAGSDVASGCADGCTIRVATAAADNHSIQEGNVTGEYAIVIAPDEADRLDAHMFSHDNFGATNPNDPSHGSAYKKRKGLAQAVQAQQDSYAGSAEIVMRRGVSSTKFLRIVAGSEASRATLIQEMRKSGIQEVNGVPIEDFIVVAQTKGEVYKKYVKPAGY